jgi:lipoyl(octanoyl) transferase
MSIQLHNKSFNSVFNASFDFINTGFSDGAFNMDFDVRRAADCLSGNAQPMFRVYGWSPWTVSLGANQRESDILPSALSSAGFGLVRRPTGGRAVLHADELTYCVVAPLPDSMGVQDAYREIHIVLLKALQSLGGGDELGFQKAQPDFRNFYKSSAMSVSCFASSARYEIEWRGRKIVGSAQRFSDGVLLQHGSILLGTGHERLADVVKVGEETERERLREFIASHSATMEEVAGKKIAYDDCAEAIYKALNDDI